MKFLNFITNCYYSTYNGTVVKIFHDFRGFSYEAENKISDAHRHLAFFISRPGIR